jgi:hypothetical protein
LDLNQRPPGYEPDELPYCVPFSPASLFLASSGRTGPHDPEKRGKCPPGSHEDEEGVEPDGDA